MSRTVAVQADTTVFSIEASADVGTSLDAVLVALKDAGVTTGDMVSVSTATGLSFYPSTPPQPVTMEYTFRITVPRASIDAVIAKLMKARESKSLTGLNYTTTNTLSDDAIEQARLAVLPDLIADAKQKASVVAAASGTVTGPLGFVQGGAGSASGADFAFPLSARFGATGADGITVSATRTVNVAPQSALFSVAVSLPAGASAAQAAALVADAGFSAANVVGYGFTDRTSQLPPVSTATANYTFQLTVSYDRLRDMIGTLAKTTVPKVEAAGGSMSYSFSLMANDQAIRDAAQGLVPGLLAGLTKQAQQIADASGLNLRALRSISDTTIQQVQTASVSTFASPGFAVLLSTLISTPNRLSAIVGLTATFGVARNPSSGN